MDDATHGRLWRLWDEHRSALFPPADRGRELAGVDLMLLDASIAGCASSALTGPLDARRRECLESGIGQLAAAPRPELLNPAVRPERDGHIAAGTERRTAVKAIAAGSSRAALAGEGIAVPALVGHLIEFNPIGREPLLYGRPANRLPAPSGPEKRGPVAPAGAQ